MNALEEKLFSIRTHNGFVTMTSKKTNEHRTFRVWSQGKDAKFMPTKRLLGLLTGPDNESDYRTFGVLGDDGQIHLWRKHQGDKFFQWVSLALVNPERFLEKVDFSFDARCRKCNRLLTDPESCRLGIGPICRGENE